MITEIEDPQPVLDKINKALRNGCGITLSAQELVTLWCTYGDENRSSAGYRVLRIKDSP